MGLGDAHAPGATPLDPDEASGLIPQHIRTQQELNEWEQDNILNASRWALRARPTDVLTEAFVRDLHRRMFDRTWKWAGDFRRSDKNIGVHWLRISVELRVLLDDTRYWFDNGTYPLDEVAARFHHRLVSIHPFANGNGRHSRLITDVLLTRHGGSLFTWGSGDLFASGNTRTRYIASLRAADGGDYSALLAFIRS
jgi:Fic-DOC domain mobile mystery protein B